MFNYEQLMKNRPDVYDILKFLCNCNFYSEKTWGRGRWQTTSKMKIGKSKNNEEEENVYWNIGFFGSFLFFFWFKDYCQKDRGWSCPFFVDRVAVKTIRLLRQSFCSCRADSRNLGWLQRQFLQCFQSRGHWAWDWVLRALWCLRLSEEEGFLAFPFWFSWWIHGPRKKLLNTWIHSCCCEELCNRF